MNTSASAAQGDKGDDPVAMPLGTGDLRQIGNFQIIGLLGAGGMGEVYLGVAGGRYAAVKLIRPQLVSPERFEREVATLLRVPPGVGPRLLAFDGTAERPWFATEYVPGITLEQAVQGSGPLPAGALWLLLARTAAHLLKIRERKIVHRDLKPANIMLVRDDVRLIDFGIALDGDKERLTRNGAGCGTAGFKAPEQQGDGPVTAPADVYALGATLVYAASDPRRRPDLRSLCRADPALAAVTQRCLVEDPAARHSADQLVEIAREHEFPGHLCWPQKVTRRIAVREAFAGRPIFEVTTIPPTSEHWPVPEEIGPGQVGREPGPGSVHGRPPGEPAKRLRSLMLAVGATVGIATAVVTGAVYGVATALDSGLEAGLLAALVNGTVNGIGAGLTFGLMHGFAARFTTGRPVSVLSRPLAASPFAALLVMIATGLVIGAGYRLALGSVPGLAAGLMAAAGTGIMTAWGRWLVLTRIWLPLSGRAAGKR